MKKTAVYLFLIFISASIMHTQSRIETRARKNYYKGLKKYREFKKYRNTSRDIDSSLNTIFGYLRKARRYLVIRKFYSALRLANKALEILDTIERKVKSGGTGLTKNKIMTRYFYVSSIYTLMKKYNFRSDKIMQIFTSAKNNIKFAGNFIREKNYKKAIIYIKIARKILLSIPDVYGKELDKETAARNKIFNAGVLAEFTRLYYINDLETKGEYRKYRYHISKARERFKILDYNGVNIQTKKALQKLKQVQILHKRKSKERRARFKKCMDANYAIAYAQSLRRSASQQINKSGIYNAFYLARRYLAKAKHLQNRGYCKDAYEMARKSLNLLFKIRKMHGNLLSGKKNAERLLKRAIILFNRAKQKRLPFDAEEHLDKAKRDIKQSRGYIKRANYEMAKNKLKATIIRLKSLLR